MREEYLAGNATDDLHMFQSVTKNVTSAIVGIAVEQRLIAWVEQRVLEPG